MVSRRRKPPVSSPNIRRMRDNDKNAALRDPRPSIDRDRAGFSQQRSDALTHVVSVMDGRDLSRDVHGRGAQMIRRWRPHDNTVINICGASIGRGSICRDASHPRHSPRRMRQGMKPLRKPPGQRRPVRSCPRSGLARSPAQTEIRFARPSRARPGLVVRSGRAFFSNLRISLKFL